MRLLLQCGHQVNVFDYGRNSPLHTLVATLQTVRRTEAELLDLVQEIIGLFHQHGMHFDAVNCEGLRPALLCGSSNFFDQFYFTFNLPINHFSINNNWRLLISGTVEQTIRKIESREISLKCLAARTIAVHRITFRGGQVPKALEAFVCLHTATKL